VLPWSYADGSIICGAPDHPAHDAQATTNPTVAQDQRRVKVYRRAGGAWQAATYGDGASFELPTLSTSIPVADVYDGILDAAGRSQLR
jgi:hypothetical protein